MSYERRFLARVLVITWVAGLIGTALAWSADRGASYLAALESIKAGELQEQVNYLADEKREGREAGTRGGYAAGEYVRQRLAALKLHGAGTDGAYLQAFSPNFRNVLAKLEGSDPKLRNDVIVLGAHYDHVGVGKKGNTLGQVGLVHPGADDNASGASGLLETAQAFTILSEPPRRTILFAFFDAEEKGMLGSKYWVAHPTIPVEHVRLLVNMDMIGRLRNDRLLVFGTRSGYGLRRSVSTHNESSLRLEFLWNALPNADHFPFFSHDIPFLSLHTDLHEQYHRPGDKAELIDSAGIRRVVRLLFGLIYDLANAEQTPAFRAAARNESEETRRTLAQQPPQLPERLGASWSSEPSTDRGILLSGVSAQSAAQRADLRPGDRILEFAGRAIRLSDDLTGAVLAAPAETSAVILRPGQEKPGQERLGPIKIELEGKPLRVGIVWRVDDAEPGTAILTGVVPGSPAARSGLQADDRIYQVNGRNFTGEEELLKLLGALPSPIHLGIERSGQLRSVELRIEAIPLRRAA
jgi:membrane-associated protease RseP (regulator of RpoE activity)